MSEMITVPEVKTLVVGRADITSYQSTVLQEARRRVAETQARVTEAQAGVAAAQEANEPRQISTWRSILTRSNKRLRRESRFLKAVESGYLPIPRMPAVNLKYIETAIPPEALVSLKEAKKTGAFEWFGVIDGRDATSTGWPVTRRLRGRDPILVGIVLGEPFPIAWWR